VAAAVRRRQAARAGRHLLWERHRTVPPGLLPQSPASSSKLFWRTVGSIELTDAAFAIDSVLAGIALVGPPPADTPANVVHPKLWVVVTGGMVGVVMMRFAAAGFAKLISRFPRFELAAHLMVLVVALKLLVDYALNLTGRDAHFQSPSSPAFWAFWVGMAASAGVGFIPVAGDVVRPAHGP